MPSCDFALWKCGKRPLRRWKTDIHGPMEKPPAFPQPANIVSHSSASMTVYAHSHSAYYGEYPSRPILIEREKREQKKKRERHPRPKPKAALPLCYGSSHSVMEKCSKQPLCPPSNQRERPTWGNHKDGSRKSRHRRFFSPFSTPIPAFFRACGLVMGTGDEDCPEALLAGMDTTLADLVISAAAVLPEEEGPFQPPLLAPAHRSCSGGFFCWALSGGLRSPHSRLASASRSRMEGRFSGAPLCASPWAFSCSSPLRPLFSTPSIIP